MHTSDTRAQGRRAMVTGPEHVPSFCVTRQKTEMELADDDRLAPARWIIAAFGLLAAVFLGGGLLAWVVSAALRAWR